MFKPGKYLYNTHQGEFKYFLEIISEPKWTASKIGCYINYKNVCYNKNTAEFTTGVRTGTLFIINTRMLTGDFYVYNMHKDHIEICTEEDIREGRLQHVNKEI